MARRNGFSVNYPAKKPLQWATEMDSPSTLFMIIDCDARTLSFVADNLWLGVAHVFPSDCGPLHAAISTVYGYGSIHLIYFGTSVDGPSSLIHLSRCKVVEPLRSEKDLATLPLPKRIVVQLQPYVHRSKKEEKVLRLRRIVETAITLRDQVDWSELREFKNFYKQFEAKKLIGTFSASWR